MRIVTLEEHITFPEIVAQLPKEVLDDTHQSPAITRVADKLADVTGERLSSMDESGVTMQVISVVGPGANLLDPKKGPAFAKAYNDSMAEKIAAHPDRFTAFAHLPMSNPQAAAEELERTVKQYGFKGALINGITNDEFLDHPKFAVLFEKAQELDVPVYLHPGLPPEAVKNVYYSGLPKQSGMVLSIAGWGWHSETALHVLRLIISGTLDKYPKFKMIIGHMGEMLPMMMARCDNIFKPGENGINQRTISQTLRDQVYITTSGLFTQPPFIVALDTFGIDNILFSVDYPFSPNEAGKKFLNGLTIPLEDMEKLAHGNADKLLKLV